MKPIWEPFSHIRFEAESHTYTGNGQEYTSVSSMIAQYSQSFDSELHSKRVAKKEGVSQDEIKSRWNIRRDYSIVKGREFHLYVEKYLTENRKIDTITPIDSEKKSFHLFWDEKNKDKYDVVGCELIVADAEHLIAGTIDCLVKNKKTNKFYLLDWKTNKKINDSNKFQNFLGPFQNLEDCEVNKYSIQMYCYKKLIELNTDIKIEDLYLIHFHSTEGSTPIPCKNVSIEVDKMFEERKKSLAAKAPSA